MLKSNANMDEIDIKAKGFIYCVKHESRTYNWFGELTDRTLVGDYHRIENSSLSYEEQCSEKEAAFIILMKFDWDEISENNTIPISMSLRKFRQVCDNRELVKDLVLKEMESRKKIIHKFQKSLKTKKDVETYIKEYFKQCPVSNALDLFELCSM